MPCRKLTVIDENVDERPTKLATAASQRVTGLVCRHKMLICSLKVKSHYLGFAPKQWEGGGGGVPITAQAHSLDVP